MSNHTENYEKLAEVIKAHRNEKGALMPVLQQAQNIFGCVSEDVQKIIAEGLETPAELLKVLELDVDLLQGYFLAKPSAVPKPVSAESSCLL